MASSWGSSIPCWPGLTVTVIPVLATHYGLTDFSMSSRTAVISDLFSVTGHIATFYSWFSIPYYFGLTVALIFSLMSLSRILTVIIVFCDLALYFTYFFGSVFLVCLLFGIFWTLGLWLLCIYVMKLLAPPFTKKQKKKTKNKNTGWVVRSSWHQKLIKNSNRSLKNYISYCHKGRTMYLFQDLI